MVKRKARFLVLLIYGIFSMIPVQGSMLYSAPHWLNGTLFFNTIGLDKSSYPQMSTINQYIFAVNFDTGRITSKSVISNSVLSKDPYNDNVILFNTGRPGLHADEYNNRREWKIMEFEFIGVGEGEMILQSERIVTDLRYYPITVLCLSIQNDGAMETIYYRSVVTKETDDTEVQLILDKGHLNRFDHEVSILKSFDEQNAFQDMSYAFSTKNIAINDRKGNLYIIDKKDASIIQCPETKLVIGALCWLDDDTLVYCTDASDGWIAGKKGLKALHLWNTKTGELSSLSSLWGEKSEFMIENNADPSVLTINQDKTIIALYLPGDGLSVYSEDRIGTIMFVSLSNGEQFEMVPWIQYDNNEKNLQIGDYITSDDGVTILDPSGYADLNLVWD